MKNKVTIIPADNLIIVDGEALQFEFVADANIHAIQWLNGEGHIEFKDKTANRKTVYADDVETFVLLWEEEWERLNQPLPEPTFDELKQAKLVEINAEYTSRAKTVKIGTPMDEVLTWDIQRVEALEWQANSAALTPNVDLLANSRGIDRVELLKKIITKVKSYEAYIFVLTGKRQKYEDAIKSAESADELAAITWVS